MFVIVLLSIYFKSMKCAKTKINDCYFFIKVIKYLQIRSVLKN